MMPVLDIEKDTTVDVKKFILDFFSAFKSPMMLYSYQPYLDKYLPPDHGFENVLLWEAQYRNELTPTLPRGWGHVTLWQYTNLGHEDGIPVAVDENKPFTQDFVYYQ